MGRHKKAITDDHLRQIEQLAGYGLTEAAISAVIGVSQDTFARRKQDRDEVVRALARGKAKAEAIVGQALFVRCKDGDVPAIKWYEITRLGRVDASQVRHADAKGDTLPVPQVNVYVPDNGRGVAHIAPVRLRVPSNGNGR